MSDRVFPISKSDAFEKLAKVTSIDYDSVAKKTGELLKQASTADSTPKNSVKPVRTAPMQKTASKEESYPSVEELFLSAPDGYVRIPGSDYLEKCIANNDEINYKKALAIRTKARTAMANLAAEAQAEKSKKDKEERKAKREALKVEAEEKPEEKMEECECEEDMKEKPEKCEEPDEAVDKEAAVANRLIRLGFPDKMAHAYASAMWGDQIPEEITQLANAEGISKEAKNKLFLSMLKTSKLEEKDKNRLFEYWTKDLGYEVDWSKDLVADIDPVTGEQS